MSSESTPAHFGHEAFPRKPLLGALTLVGLALLAVGAARITQVGTPVAADVVSAIAIERDLRFEDRPDGSIAVLDDHDGALIDTLAPGSNNFIRGTLRALVRERRQDSIGGVSAFRLMAKQDGRLLLTDPATKRTIDLGSFGPTNAQAFSRLLVTPNHAALPTQTASVVTAPAR